MKDFIKEHLNGYDDVTKELEMGTQILIDRFPEATDEEKQEIVKFIGDVNRKELSIYPKIEKIRDWVNKQNDN